MEAWEVKVKVQSAVALCSHDGVRIRVLCRECAEVALRAAYAAGREAGLGESVGILQGIPVESGEKRRVIWTAIAALEAVRGGSRPEGAGKETG